MSRTMDRCRLIKRYGPPRRYDGKCEGFAKSNDDDETCDTCKKCRVYYVNVEERESQDG